MRSRSVRSSSASKTRFDRSESSSVIAARRFFVEGAREIGSVVEIGGSDARKIARVLRLHEGDRIEVIDSAATAFSAAIDDVGAVVRARLLSTIGEGVAIGLRLEVAQAVPKGQRMEFVIEKGTELGASAFLPFYCERSVACAAGAQRIERWQRVARSSAQQSGRRDIPAVLEPVQFDALLEVFPTYDAVLFAWELAAPMPLRERLATALPTGGRVLIVVGPEGGFTHAEAESAERHGADLLSLGPRILRTDTAALALLAVIGAVAS
jgi:16S rRNA (uracil1498-N3)-methyltransferase